MSSVRVRRRCTVAPAATAGQLPVPGRRVELSALDTLWVPLPPLVRVHLFTPSPAVPFSELSESLRRSLAETLPSFHPFTGELVYSPSTHTVALVCPEEEDSGGGGVAFVEAETDMDLGSLAGDEEVDVDAFMQLAPDIRRDELPAPVMAVQVTEFVNGGRGVAVGLALHHAAADGHGLWRFLEAWAAVAAANGPFLTALHDRKLVRFDGDEEFAAALLRQVAPNLPRIASVQGGEPKPPSGPFRRRTFTFSAAAVRRLKKRLVLATANADETPPSTFAALATHGWVSFARASGFDDDDDDPVFACFVADIRACLTPPVDAAYVGNCLAFNDASMSGSELAAPDGLARALSAIREAVRAVKAAPFKGKDVWVSKFAALPPGRAIVLSGSVHFPAYSVDLGLGRPARAEQPSLLVRDGEIVFTAGRETGSVQASVVLAAHKMPAFREIFALDDHAHGHASPS